jgi:DNA-directed RNA polymerase specialized sigma24 family protein
VDDGLDDGLLTALRHLPDRQREVIALRVFLDLDIDTIAAHLGVAPGTVRVHLSRGVRALRQELSASAASVASSSSSSAAAASASASAALEVNQ